MLKNAAKKKVFRCVPSSVRRMHTLCCGKPQFDLTTPLSFALSGPLPPIHALFTDNLVIWQPVAGTNRPTATPAQNIYPLHYLWPTYFSFHVQEKKLWCMKWVMTVRPASCSCNTNILPICSCLRRLYFSQSCDWAMDCQGGQINLSYL